MNDHHTPTANGPGEDGIAGYAADCFFHLHADGALSAHRPAAPDYGELAIELSAPAVIALCVLFHTIDMAHLLERVVARQNQS